MLNESDAVNRSAATGATTVYPYTFKIYDVSELEVLANASVLTLNVDYSVSGVGADGGGNVTTAVAHDNGTIITRLRKQPTTQPSNYQAEAFPPERIEKDFDKLAMRLQQVKESIRRCLAFVKSSSTVDQLVDTPVVGSFARAKVGGGIDWATVVSAGAISVPVSVADGGTGVTTATGTGSVVKQDSPTLNTPIITGLSLTGVNAISMTGGINDALSTVASAATPNIFAVAVGNTINYTGATPCTGFTASPQAGAQRLLVCATAAPFVAGANMLIDGITSGSTFTAEAGDKLLVVAVTTTQFRLTPMKANGQSVALYSPPLAGHLWRCTMSNSVGDATNDITVTEGEASSNDAALGNRVIMSLSSAITKQLDAAWSVGSNVGGRMSAAALADTTYHVWVILRPDTNVVDVGFDTSATAPTLPANYTKARRIGSIVRNGGTIILFTQEGDNFLLKTTAKPANTTNPGLAAVTATLTNVPIGIAVQAIMNFNVQQSGAVAMTAYLSPLSATNEAPIVYNAVPAVPGYTFSNQGTSGSNAGGEIVLATDLSAQFRYRLSSSDGGTVVGWISLGWIDTRGRVA